MRGRNVGITWVSVVKAIGDVDQLQVSTRKTVNKLYILIKMRGVERAKQVCLYFVVTTCETECLSETPSGISERHSVCYCVVNGIKKRFNTCLYVPFWKGRSKSICVCYNSTWHVLISLNIPVYLVGYRVCVCARAIYPDTHNVNTDRCIADKRCTQRNKRRHYC